MSFVESIDARCAAAATRRVAAASSLRVVVIITVTGRALSESLGHSLGTEGENVQRHDAEWSEERRFAVQGMRRVQPAIHVA